MTIRWLDKQANRIRRHLGLSRYHPRRRWLTYCPMCGRKLRGIGGELMGGGKPYEVFKCSVHGYLDYRWGLNDEGDPNNPRDTMYTLEWPAHPKDHWEAQRRREYIGTEWGKPV